MLCDATLVSEMTYNVLMGALNPTHSLTHSLTLRRYLSSAASVPRSVLQLVISFIAAGFRQHNTVRHCAGCPEAATVDDELHGIMEGRCGRT